MSDRRNDVVQPSPCNDDRAESLVVEAYLQLPLLPRQVDGSWIAPLKRCRRCEFRPSLAILRFSLAIQKGSRSREKGMRSTTSPPPLRVLVAEAHPLVALGLADILD